MVSMGPKRILFIIPEMSVGGAQRSLAKISFEMAKDHLVWVVVFDQDSRTAYDCGGEMISLDVRGGKNWLGKAISMVNRVTKLRAVKRRLNIDVAISFLEGADYINILSQRKERVVLSIRGSKLHDENMHRRFFFSKAIYSHSISLPEGESDHCCESWDCLGINDSLRHKRSHQGYF